MYHHSTVKFNQFEAGLTPGGVKTVELGMEQKLKNPDCVLTWLVWYSLRRTGLKAK